MEQIPALEIETALKEKARGLVKPKWKLADYVGGGTSELHYLDLKVPVVRGTFKTGFSFSKTEPQEQWRIYDEVWRRSNVFEAMLMPVFWADTRPLAEVHENKSRILK